MHRPQSSSDFSNVQLDDFELLAEGRSKRIYRLDSSTCIVQLKPTLRSLTYKRDEIVPGTDKLRLDFFEAAANQLKASGQKVAFLERTGEVTYLAEVCTAPPFEVIVKNRSTGSTTRNYPGLFSEGYCFKEPVVKLDFRRDPEDLPISFDYLREYGLCPKSVKELALATNSVLADWLKPFELWDFCIIVDKNQLGEYRIASELSPDGMRVRSSDGESFDKDLFRQGATHERIVTQWRSLNQQLRVYEQ